MFVVKEKGVFDMFKKKGERQGIFVWRTGNKGGRRQEGRKEGKTTQGLRRAYQLTKGLFFQKGCIVHEWMHGWKKEEGKRLAASKTTATNIHRKERNDG